MSTSPQAVSAPPVDTNAVPFGVVLDRELDEIDRQRRLRGQSQPVPPRGAPTTANEEAVQRKACHRADAANLVGLALSGGGIRSATFNLGVLQAFAEAGFLRGVDYLSTVSGGGYIGSWLAGCIRNLPPGRDQAAIERVFLPDSDVPSENNETHALRFLREYSNYLTPRLGLLGIDTWTSIAIYLRNLFLNLIVVTGVIAVVVFIPALVYLLTYGAFGFVLQPGFQLATLIACGALLAVAVVFIGLNQQTCGRGGATRFPRLSSQKGVQLGVIAPVLLAVWCATIWFVSYALSNPASAWFWAVIGVAANSMAWLLGWIIVAPFDKNRELRDGRGVRAWWRVCGVVLSGIVGGMMLYGIHHGVYWLMSNRVNSADAWEVVTWTPPALLLVLLITLTLQIGIARYSFSEQDREWSGRLGACLLICTWLWLALFLVASPRVPALMKHAFVSWSALGAWVLSTASGVWAGNSGKTGKPGVINNREVVARFAPWAFVVGLIIGVSLAIQTIHAALGLGYPSYPADVIAVLGIAGIAVFVSLRVDLNLFSMHLLYRNRLVRCYLGASRPQRRPQPFTGFDPDDDFPLCELTADHGYAGPYHIFNAALNLVHGQELAWQERKAEAFVFTPLYCGFDLANVSKGKSLRDTKRKLAGAAYRPTGQYAYRDGLLAGSATAISGAAASPNMGYHSSPAVTFLLTVFNIRLGWWLGNPRSDRSWRHSGPKFGLLYLISELLGLTDDRSQYVYLSDGGHFENLGIYELVRRRCRLIIACDASQDPKMRFDDLGSAIAKCRTDFGVEITGLDLKELRLGADGVHSNAHYAIGNIDYGENIKGKLLYIKPSLTGRAEEPVDVTNYQLRHPEFPHESTGDQWFSESQFESYRKLGKCIASQLLHDEQFDKVLPLKVAAAM